MSEHTAESDEPVYVDGTWSPEMAELLGRSDEKEPQPLSVWTSREGHFRPFPGTPDDRWDALFDALPEHLWETWRERAFGTLSVASRDGVIHVSGWPWWVPQWYIRRLLADLAGRHGVGGDAYVVTERTVLVNPPGERT